MFLVKVIVLIWFQMLIRWTLPRFRYDQVMDLCWKIMLPLSLANIVVTALGDPDRAGGHALMRTGVSSTCSPVLAVASALGMVLNLRNTVNSALSLVVSMISLAGLYVPARGAARRG